MSAVDRPHWIVRVMNCISDPAWWDGVLLGMAVSLGGGVIVFLYLSGQ